ncbi:MAG: NUDIX hydrolase [Clostridia bacterium]|nr:NUDIX hydrolase [Clostridia bacterium]
MKNQFNETEFHELSTIFHNKPICEELSIRYNSNGYFNKVRKSLEKNRRGEVVFCILRPNNKIITVTCSEYPKGIFRIPTGGIEYNENILKTLDREVKEELGLQVEVTDFVGVLKIKFSYKEESFMFYSYLFILREVSGNLLVDATDNEVSDIKEVDLEGLQEVVEMLKNIKGKWHDWGIFRYETSNAILKYLKYQKVS